MRRRSKIRAAAAVLLAGSLLVAVASPATSAEDEGPKIRTVAGGIPSGLPATEVSVHPSDVDVAPSGDLFITDAGIGVIWRMSDDGRLHHFAGSGTMCLPDPSRCAGDGGPATEAFLQAPAAVHVAANGDVYVAEQRGDRVRRIDAQTGRIHPFAGSGDRGHSDAAMGGPALDAPIPLPAEIDMDAQGNVFIASLYSRIYRVAPDGTITVAAGCGDQRYPTCWNGQDGAPVEGTWVGANAGTNGNGWGFAVAPNGDLIISDLARVLRLDMDQQVYRVVTGQWPTYASFPGEGEDGPAGDAHVGVIVAAAFAPSGELYMLEGGGSFTNPWNRVQKIETPVGPEGILRHVGGLGTGNAFAGDGGPAKQARFAFSQPHETWTGQGMDIGPDGTVYIADVLNNRVRAIAPNGIVRTVAGNGHGGPPGYRANTNDLAPSDGTAEGQTIRGAFSGDARAADTAQLSAPADVETDRDGNLFILDRYANRVRRVDADTGKITTVAGTGCAGVRCPYPFPPFEDGKPATQVQLAYPVDIAFDRTGTQLYIAERGFRRVRQVNLGKRAFTAYASSPKPVRIEPGQIRTVLGEGVNVPTQGAPWGPSYSGCGLVKPYCGDGMTWDMWSPGELQGVAADSKGNLYASDTRASQVVRVDAVTGQVTAVAGKTLVSNCKGAVSDGVPGRATELCGPTVLQVSPDDSTLYIVETGWFGDLESIQNLAGGSWDVASRIRKVDLTSPAYVTSVVAGAGPSGFGGDGGPARNANLGAPHGLTIGPDGSLYVSDTGNHRIRRIAPNGTITTVAGAGIYGGPMEHEGCAFAGDGGAPADGRLCAPLGIEMALDGTLYVADALNNRVRAIEGL